MPRTEKEAVNSMQIPMEFNYSKQSQTVTIEIINNEPWFLAKDICDILELQNPSDILAKTLDEDEKLTYTVDRSGQARKMLFVNESGLYNLIFQSRKPEAKKFRKWVTNEVLPSIRKTGSFGKNVVANPLSAESVNELLLYVEQKEYEGFTWYAAIQLRTLFGKQPRSGSMNPKFWELEKKGMAIKLPQGNINSRWFVRREAIPLLLSIRPTSLINVSIIKALQGGAQ